MIKFIKNIFSKKKEYKPYTTELNSFVLGRPIDRIHLRDYNDNRFDNNEFYRLNIETGLILFIDLTDNKEIEDYIDENYVTFKDAMQLKGRTFIKSINDVEKPAELNISYFYPYLRTVSFDKSVLEEETFLLDFIGYNGNIKTGFLSFTSNGMSFLGLKKNESVEEFVRQYINNLAVDNVNTNTTRILYSIKGEGADDGEPNIEIDLETQSILNQIQDNLLKLKQSGQFFLLAPKLEKMVKSIFALEASLDIIQSELYINSEFRIFLPQYQNVEITLSHLTKAIYFLFLRHPEGILLNEIYKYENELLAIYKAISYQGSFDKIKNSIQELIANEKAIFVHFSRIKSAFIKNFTDSYAKFYYIQGEKGKKKYIRLPSSKIIFEKEI